MKNSLLVVIVVLTSCSLITACGPDVPPGYTDNNSNNNSPDVESHDTQNDQPDTQNSPDANSPDTNDANIEHDTTPPDNSCETTTTPCGTCELGATIHCNDTTNPLHDTCEIHPILEPLDCDKLIFVDADLGKNGTTGKKETPLKNLTDGITKAVDNNLKAVIVAGNEDSGQQTGPITLADGVSIIAGYNSNFVHTPQNYAKIKTPTTADQDIIGLLAKNITKSTTLSRLEIITEDAPPGSFSNYGIHADNTPGLTLNHIKVTTGKGGDGHTGKVGLKGDDGPNGKKFDHFTITGRGSVFEPGKSTKNEKCPTITTGAAGGRGENIGDRNIPPEAAPGDDAETAKGGAAGKISDPAGKDGEDAPTATAKGAPGTGGKAAGKIVNAYWLADQHGGIGDIGNDGEGGAGGGGAWAATFKMTASAGGGGGAGGCAGSGGKGGKNGGASFGLFLVQSNINIQNSTFQANAGGTGGNGGLGGPGGKGGTGGTGGDLPDSPRAGTGGNGSPGTAGGQGGGGAGGVSYGVYCHESTPVLQENVIFKKGYSAPGGESSIPTSNGQDGPTEDAVGCNL